MNSGTIWLLGFLFLGLGGMMWLVVRTVLRQASLYPKAEIPGSGKYPISDSLEHSEGVLIIGHGGKILSLNRSGFLLFGLRPGEFYNFETLSQKIRPTDALYEICSLPSERQITLNGQLVNVSSYTVDHGMLVSFRLPQVETVTTTAQSKFVPLDVISKLTQLTATNLNLENSLEKVFKELSVLVPNDYVEITIWDAELEVLVPYQYRTNSSDKMTKGEERYKIGESFSGLMVKTHQPLWIEDISSFHQLQFEKDENRILLNSFMGFPLILEHEVIGTLGIGSNKSSGFQEDDRELIKQVAVQVTAIIHNAQLLEIEKLRASELSALAQLSQSFSISHDTEKIFEKMLSIIGSMIPVEILGFLIFNQNSNILEAQKPFKGLPDQFVEIFKSDLSKNSEAKKLIEDQDVLITDSAIEDSHWRNLGLAHVARAASMRKAVLVPLISGGNSHGYLLGSNHIQGDTGFSQQEMHLLMIVANQAAPLIENIYLISQLNKRAQTAEILQKIAMLTNSKSSRRDVLSYGVNEIVRILKADFAAVFLLNSMNGELEIDEESLFNNDSELSSEIKGVQVDDSRYQSTATYTKSTHVMGQFNETNPTIPFYQNLLDLLRLQSAIVVPLMSGETSIGEIIIGSCQLSFYDHGDVQEIIPIADQIASSLDQIKDFYQSFDTPGKALSGSSFMFRISNDISVSTDLENVLTILVDEAKSILNVDRCTVYLYEKDDVKNDALRNVHNIGDEKNRELSEKEITFLESATPSIISEASPEPEIILPEDIHSAAILPFQIQKKYCGLLYLLSQKEEAFNENSLNIGQSLLTQFSKVVEQSLQQEAQKQDREILEKKLENQKKLFEISEVLRPGQPFNVSMDAIAEAIIEVTPFEVVLISIYDPSIQAFRRHTAKGVDPKIWKELQFKNQPWLPLSKLLKPEYQFNNVFFIPQEEIPNLPEGVHSITTYVEQEDDIKNKWRPNDICIIPLYDLIGEPLGLISVDNPKNGLRPTSSVMESLNLFSIQAGLLIENNRSITDIRERLANLTEANTKLKEALDASQSNVPVLIQKHLEQKEANQTLIQKLNKVQSVFDIAVSAAKQSDPLEVVIKVADKLISNYEMQFGLIAEKNSKDFLKLIKVIGEIPEEIYLDALLGQKNPIYSVLETQKALWVNHVQSDANWMTSPLLNALNAKFFIAIPFEKSKNKTLVLLLVSNQPVDQIDQQDADLVGELVVQVTEIIKKQSGIEETKQHLGEVIQLLDFSQKLGNLNPQEILDKLLETSLEFVEPAQTGWIGIWNEQNFWLEPQVAKGYLYNKQLLNIQFKQGDKSLPVNVFEAKLPQIVDQVEFPIHYPLYAEQLIHYKEATGGRLPMSDLVVPLFVPDKGIGVIVLENFDEYSVFTNEDKNLVFSLAQQAAFAIQNAYLLQTIQKRSDQLQLFSDVSGKIGTSLYKSNLIESLLDQLKDVVDYDTATLWLLKNEKLQIESVRGFSDSENRIGISTDVRDSSLFQEMKSKNEVISIADIRSDERFLLMTEPENLSWLGIPIVSKSQLIGMIALEKKRAGFYDADTIQITKKFALHVSTAMENAGLFEDTVRRSIELNEQSNRLAVLNHFFSEITLNLDLARIFNLTLSQIVSSLRCDMVSIMMIENNKILLKSHQPEISSPLLRQDYSQNPLLQRLKETKGVYYSREISQEKDLEGLNSTFFEKFAVQSALFVPLLFSGEVTGWLILGSQKLRRFLSEELELVQAIANQAAVAIQNARLLEETRILAEELDNSVFQKNVTVEQKFITGLSDNILEAVADGVMVTDSARNVLLFNQAALKIVEINSGQGAELNIEEIRALFGASSSDWLDTIKNWTEQPKLIQDNETFSDIFNLDNNRVVSIHLAPVFNEKIFLGTVSIIRDITLEAQVDQFKSDFVANVSHELRTPLTAIKGYADIMLMGAAGKISDQQKKFLEIIHTHTERLNILVDDLLDVSNIETGKLKLALKPLDLIGMTERVMMNIRIKSEEDKKSMFLHMDAPEDLPQVEGDPNRVFQIFDNLVSNSYNYTNEKGTILIKLREKGNMVQVDVQDTGIGIPDRIKDRIFERFYRGDDPNIQSISGTGLGLAVSKTLIEMHGGKIWFESSGIPGEGSVFSFTLPIYQR